MGTKPWFITTTLGALALSTALNAADNGKPAVPPPDPDKAAAVAAEGVRNNAIRKGTALLGRVVKAEGGDEVGTIRDLVVDSTSGQIAYVIIERQAQQGNGRQYAFPFAAMQEDTARKNLILNVKPGLLEDKRGFTSTSWPAMSDEAWAKETHAHYGLQPYWEEDADLSAESPKTDLPKDAPATSAKQPDKTQPDSKTHRREPMHPAISKDHFWTNRLTEMLGKPITNAAGEELGTMSDIMIDMRGRAVYGVVKPNGDTEAKLAAVPWSAVQADGAKKQYLIDTDRATLDFIGFKGTDWPNMHDVYWARKNHEVFKREPYWLTYGYPIEDEYGIGWRSSSAYGQLFADQPARTVEGFVTEIKEFSLAQGADKGRLVILRMEDGSLQTIHLGPAAFMDLQREKFNLRQGEKITITGPMARFEGGEVIQARELKSKDGALTIRDEKGRPQWEQDSRQRNREMRRQFDREKRQEKALVPGDKR